MAVKLGYGGVANTNGARDFSGKAAAPIVVISSDGSGGPWMLIGPTRLGRLFLLLILIGGIACHA